MKDEGIIPPPSTWSSSEIPVKTLSLFCPTTSAKGKTLGFSEEDLRTFLELAGGSFSSTKLSKLPQEGHLPNHFKDLYPHS
jgi:hypothetical protein